MPPQNQLAAPRPATVKTLAESAVYKSRFNEVLGQNAAAFVVSLTSQCSAGPLSNVDPQSVLAAAFTAASLKLPVDRNLGFAWIVPYRGSAQFQMGYRGYIQLALRTSQYERLNAFAVNAEALAGFDDVGEPVIDFAKLDDDKEAVGYAIVWKLINGFRKIIYWSKAKVEKHAKRYSQSFNSASSPWKTHFDEMALKTVVGNGLKKWGILSTEMQMAFSRDGAMQKDIDGEIIHGDAIPIEAGRVGQPSEGQSPIEQLTQSSEAPESSAGPSSEPAPAKGPDKKALTAKILKKLEAKGVGKVRLMQHLIEKGQFPAGMKFEDISAFDLDAIDENLDSHLEEIAP